MHSLVLGFAATCSRAGQWQQALWTDHCLFCWPKWETDSFGIVDAAYQKPILSPSIKPHFGTASFLMAFF